MRKLLFRSRSGEGYPMVIAVTLCLLMLFMVIAEYFRVNIIVQGVRDAVQQAVIATVNENYDDVYHSVREGYAAGWFPEGDGEWFESVDAGDIYGNLSYILGLTTDGEGYARTRLFEMAKWLEESQNLLDWIEKTPAEKQAWMEQVS